MADTERAAPPRRRRRRQTLAARARPAPGSHDPTEGESVTAVLGRLTNPFLFVGLAALAFLAWILRQELVVLFAAVLFGTALYRGAAWLSQRTRIAHGVAVGVWFVLSLGVFGSFFVFAGQQLTNQYGELGAQIPAALEKVEEQLSGVPLLHTFGDQLEEIRTGMSQRGDDAADQMTPEEQDAAQARTLRVVDVTLQALGTIGLVLIVAFYLAFDGVRYMQAVVRLAPPRHRHAAQDLFDSLGRALPQWLLGQLATMGLVAALTTPGLLLLGVPLALLLGLIAGVFSFVPILGPIAAVIPAVLVALESAPDKVIWVLGLYAAVQFIESWFLTPQLQSRIASVPPPVLLAAQFVMGALVGLVGVIFSTPLALALIVLTQVLYIRHTLGEFVEPPGSPGT